MVEKEEKQLIKKGASKRELKEFRKEHLKKAALKPKKVETPKSKSFLKKFKKMPLKKLPQKFQE